MTPPSRHAPQVMRFGLVGVAATATYLLLMNVLLRPFVEYSPGATNALSQIIALMVSYWGHRIFTFKSARRNREDLPRFLMATAVAVTTTSAAFEIAIRTGLTVSGASICVALLYPAISYMLHTFWTFRSSG